MKKSLKSEAGYVSVELVWQVSPDMLVGQLPALANAGIGQDEIAEVLQSAWVLALVEIQQLLTQAELALSISLERSLADIFEDNICK